MDKKGKGLTCNFTKISTPTWVLFKLFKLYKWYQIAQRITNMSGPQSEKVRKELQIFFKKFGLNLIIECNKTTVDCLNIALNLLDRTYKPYQKPENKLHYIHKEFNHPPCIIKQIPVAIETRLLNHSSNETVFRHAVDHKKALNKSGYNVKLQYKPANQNSKNKINRIINII